MTALFAVLDSLQVVLNQAQIRLDHLVAPLAAEGLRQHWIVLSVGWVHVDADFFVKKERAILLDWCIFIDFRRLFGVDLSDVFNLGRVAAVRERVLAVSLLVEVVLDVDVDRRVE